MGGFWSWARMMGNRDGMKNQFASSWVEQAFRTAIQNAMTNKDFAAFTAVHTKYGIPMNITQDQFNEMIAAKAEIDTLHKKITEALKSGDYASWKALNKDTPLLSKIDTEAKFKKLQEMESYREKMDTLRTELGLEWPQDGMWMGMGKWGREMGQGKWMGRWMFGSWRIETSTWTNS